jgi:iron-binding CDGSH zinc finger protein
MTAETHREGVDAEATRRRVMVTNEGPVLLPGPVELVLPDGRRVISHRPVTALCACRRSRRYPICDASHRTKVRANRGPDQPC